MKKTLLFVVVCLLSTSVFSQKKQFVFIPELAEYNQTDILENKKICLIFKDDRVIPPKSKVECSFEDLAALIKKSLDTTYRGAEFIVDNSCNSTYSVMVILKSYGASFYAGMWHTEVSYAVAISNEGNDIKEDIEQINRFFNTGGNRTAKKTLSKCFNNANIRLIGFINDNILE